MYHQVEIRPRDSFKFFIRADEPLETLHFSFYTRKKSIGFGLFYLYLPNISTSTATVNEFETILPYEKIKELITNSRDDFRIQKVGQEGTLARALSSNKSEKPHSNLLNVNGIGSKSASTENLSVNSFDTQSILSSSEASPQLAFNSIQNLKIGELIEVFPIRKYNSYDYTLQCSYTIPLTGTFVLLFDNSFSINTSKHLFYHAYLSNDILPSPSSTPQLLSNNQIGSLCAAGWLSKRRTGMVKSWVRRWFQLDSSGVLSYFEDRASPLRGSIFIPDCTLIIAKNSLRFSLDSGTQVFHLRAARTEDFDFWIQVFNSFRHFGPPTTMSSSQKLSSEHGFHINSVSETLHASEKEKQIQSALLDAKDKLSFARKSFSRESLEPLEDSLKALEHLYEVLEMKVDDVGEEVFYDVQEIYVDDIDDDELEGTCRVEDSEYIDSEGEGEEDVFVDFDLESDISSLGHGSKHSHMNLPTSPKNEKFKSFITRPLAQDVGRAITEWLLTANISLNRESGSIYRTSLPFPAPPINISFASVIMKKSFPVILNEPVNILQRMAEELEYSELLDEASALVNDPIEQLLKITAFAVSGYASSVHRSERKPYNPILGETFEYIRPDKGFRFIAEKVSHQPVIVACHAESIKWRFWQDMQADTKLWGKSMLITPKGRLHLELLAPDGAVINSFTWTKVSGALRNVYSSKKMVENHGDLVIRNIQTKQEARVTFKESGLFSNSGNEIYGGVYTGKDAEVPIVSVRGRWDDMLCKEIKSADNIDGTLSQPLLQVLWKVNPMPNNYSQFFHLPFYAITLNDFPELLRQVLPKTDSRFRPDQRMLESGMIDSADGEKQRLEQIQRDRRSQHESAGTSHTPSWFKYDRSSRSWKYNEKYWSERSVAFSSSNLPQLW